MMVQMYQAGMMIRFTVNYYYSNKMLKKSKK